MKHIISFTFFYVSSLSFCFAKCHNADSNTNNLFVEIGGHSRSLYSANYEHKFNTSHKYLAFSARLGVGYTPGTGERDKGTYTKSGITIPFVLSTLVGSRNHFAQVGVSYTPSFGNTFLSVGGKSSIKYQDYESAYIISCGYRYVDVGGFNLQVFPALVFTNNLSRRFGFLFGIGAGWSW